MPHIEANITLKVTESCRSCTLSFWPLSIDLGKMQLTLDQITYQLI